MERWERGKGAGKLACLAVRGTSLATAANYPTPNSSSPPPKKNTCVVLEGLAPGTLK